MCKLNPKVDFAFKKLFGSEGNKDLLMAFINALMPEENQIKNIELKNPYNLANYRRGKMSILDIKAVDNNEVWYDIEMQIAEQMDYDKRAFYYWAKTFADQIESGDFYDKLRKTIGISILDFNYLDEEEYHNIIKPLNMKSKKQFSDLFELHFIELSKFDKGFGELKTALDRWTAFLSKAYEFDKDRIPEELASDGNIKKAIEQLEFMYLDKEEREIYEEELNGLRVRKSEIKTAVMKHDIGIIDTMLSKGLDFNTIIEYTGLTRARIKELGYKI